MPSPDDVARADDEALAWVVRLTSGDASAQDHERFRQWRDASPVHGEAIARAREIFLLMELAAPEVGTELATPALPRATPVRPAARRQAVRRWRSRSQRWLAAASVLLGVGLGYQYLHVWQFDQVTARGEQRRVALADGTRLELGADTAYSAELTDGLRRIRLARGALLVHAAADRRPLVVETDEAGIRDVGTVFGVERRDATTTVVVREGMVDVAGGGRQVRLGVDQRAVVGRDGIVGPSAVDARQETAWTRRRLIAADRPLGEVLAEVSPYASRRVVVIGDAVTRRRVSANVDLRNADAWLNTLDTFPDTHVTFLPGVIVVQ